MERYLKNLSANLHQLGPARSRWWDIVGFIRRGSGLFDPTALATTGSRSGHPRRSQFAFKFFKLLASRLHVGSDKTGDFIVVCRQRTHE